MSLSSIDAHVQVTDDFLSFLDWLTETQPETDIRYLLSKPWKWQVEFTHYMKSVGK